MTAVILAGGEGTRLRTVAKNLPKSLVDICGKTVIERQLDNFLEHGVREVVLMLGHQADKLHKRFSTGMYREANLSFHIEQTPLGTAGGLRSLRNVLRDDFFLSLGDLVFSLDLGRVAAFHRDKKAICTIVCHPNDHPADSDVLVLEGSDSTRVTGILPKNMPRQGDYQNIVAAGLMVFNPQILDFLGDGQKIDLEREVLPRAVETGRVHAYRTTEYIKDMGTPQRLQEVQESVSHGILGRRNLSQKQRAVFLDRDGTVNEHRGLIFRPEDLILIQGAPRAIVALNRSDFLCLVVTNQPVVARNLCTEQELWRIHDRLETKLGSAGAYLDDILYCPHHPDGGYRGENARYKIACTCRKPETGLIDKACVRYNIERSRSFLIGDSTADIETAARSGMKSILVMTGEGGRDGKYSARPTYVSKDIEEAVRLVLSKEPIE